MAVLDETSWQEEHHEYVYGKVKKVKDAKGRSRIRQPKSEKKISEEVDRLYDDVNYGLSDLTPNARIIGQMLEDNVMVRGRDPKRWTLATISADTVLNIDFGTVRILHGMGIHEPRLNDPLCHLVEKLKLCAVIIQSGQSLAVALNKIKPTVLDDRLEALHLTQLSTTEKTIYMSWRNGVFEAPELGAQQKRLIHWTDKNMQEELKNWRKPFGSLYPMQVLNNEQIAFLRTKTDWATPLASAIMKRTDLKLIIDTGLENQPNLQADTIDRYISVQYAEEAATAKYIQAKAQWHMKTCRAWDKIFPDSKDFKPEVLADMQAARLLCSHLQEYADMVQSITQDPRGRSGGKQMLKVHAVELAKRPFFACSQGVPKNKKIGTDQRMTEELGEAMSNQIDDTVMQEAGVQTNILKKREGITSKTDDATDLEIWRRTMNYDELSVKRSRRRAISLTR